MKASVEEDAQPVKRSIPFHGHTLSYMVTPGHLTIRNDKGEPTGSMFYVAYTIPSSQQRPVTFLFNGGPGSSTMWLRMGSFGPMKVDASNPDHPGPAVPLRAEPGYAALRHGPRVHRRADDRPVARDRQGRAERLLRRRQGPRRLHPYDPALPDEVPALEQPQVHHRRELRNDARGGIVELAARCGRPAQGITFVSTVFNFADFQGDQSLINFLPTYAADAWYHGKIADKPALEDFLQQARDFASGPYAGRCNAETCCPTKRSSRSRSAWRS